MAAPSLALLLALSAWSAQRRNEVPVLPPVQSPLGGRTNNAGTVSDRRVEVRDVQGVRQVQDAKAPAEAKADARGIAENAAEGVALAGQAGAALTGAQPPAESRENVDQALTSGRRAFDLEGERSGTVADAPVPGADGLVWKPMLEKYRGENSKNAEYPVVYFTDKQLPGMVVSIDAEGRLVDPAGRPLNGRHLYVLTRAAKGETVLYAYKPPPPRPATMAEKLVNLVSGRPAGERKHSSVAQGQDVAAAGWMEPRRGYLGVVDNASGHYVPGSSFLKQLADWLQARKARGLERTIFRAYEKTNLNVSPEALPYVELRYEDLRGFAETGKDLSPEQWGEMKDGLNAKAWTPERIARAWRRPEMRRLAAVAALLHHPDLYPGLLASKDTPSRVAALLALNDAKRSGHDGYFASYKANRRLIFQTVLAGLASEDARIVSVSAQLIGEHYDTHEERVAAARASLQALERLAADGVSDSRLARNLLHAQNVFVHSEAVTPAELGGALRRLFARWNPSRETDTQLEVEMDALAMGSVLRGQVGHMGGTPEIRTSMRALRGQLAAEARKLALAAPAGTDLGRRAEESAKKMSSTRYERLDALRDWLILNVLPAGLRPLFVD